MPIKLVNYDDQGSPEEAVKIANKMIQVDKVDAILGSLTSSNVLAAGGIYNEAKIPTIGTGNSPTWMQQGWEYVFRAGLNTALSMPHVTEKMLNLDVKKVAVFRGLDDAAKTSAETFIEEAKKAGIEVTTIESYTEGDTDFSGQVAKMINSKPDAVLRLFLQSSCGSLDLINSALTVRGFRLIQLMWQGMQSTTGYLLILTWYTTVLKKRKILK